MTAVHVPEGNPDVGAVWHYGDPFGEQRAAQRQAVVIDRSPRAVIAVSGPERLSWLHTISTQHVADLRDGDTRENLSLDGQGRVEDHWVQTDLGGVTYLDTEPWRAAALRDFLTKMVFWNKVDVGEPDLRVLTVLGPRAGDAAAALGVPVPQTGRAAALPGGGFIRRMPWPLQDATLDLLVPADQVAETTTRLGLRPAGLWTFEALRVAALRPRLGLDTDERTIPHEAGWVGGPGDSDPRAVHLEKGCYRGQETVARVHNLGKPPRVLVLLHLDGSADRPVTGDAVTAGGRTVGRVGTVVDHADLGPIALALVKRSVVEALVTGDPTVLLAGSAPAAIDTDLLPSLDGEQRGRAAVERLRQLGG